MFRKLVKNKRAQNTAEYALLISLVVAGIIAMQTYAQRALQGRIRDASKFMSQQNIGSESTEQYEPYYLQTNYTNDRDDTRTEALGNNVSSRKEDSTRKRQGSQIFNYAGSVFINGK